MILINRIRVIKKLTLDENGELSKIRMNYG